MVGFTIGTLSVLTGTTGAPLVRAAGGGAVEHATSEPRIDKADATAAKRIELARRKAVIERRLNKPRVRASDMWVLFAEAFGAVVVLCLIVWWTMFHGRSKGERKDHAATDLQPTEKARPDL